LEPGAWGVLGPGGRGGGGAQAGKAARAWVRLLFLCGLGGGER
jgi:hypothetical protein